MTLKLTAGADDVAKLASPEYVALAVCAPGANAGGAHAAMPAAFNGTVAVIESTVKVAVPVAIPSGLLSAPFIPLGCTFSWKGMLYCTEPPVAITWFPLVCEKLILEGSCVIVTETGDDVLAA